ncbi:MAG TPA: hypothetical protein VMT20_17800 [Terriglobia bacterium]|nr:hypothetical protein [Terriglobia bacterium]
MSNNQLPTEVELAYEVMPCQAMRVAEEPGPTPHPCAYFRQWGTYHSYGYESDQPPVKPGIVQVSQYLGRGPMAPEMLSGCRKAPIMSLGINPNLPGWWPATINSISPLFDTVAQYAHYFRYRETAKLDIPTQQYEQYLGGRTDGPFSGVELNVPVDADGFHTIPVELQPVQMYLNYQSLLEDLASAMGWSNHNLMVGEDVSYGNMVACASAKWITKTDPSDPSMPPMTPDQQKGIVTECFYHRQYFLRQLFQSLPLVLMIFSQSTTDAFLAEMNGRFSAGNPKVGDTISELINREVRLRYGADSQGNPLEARVIFSPHITGDPVQFKQFRSKVLAQLVSEATAGHLQYNPATGHLARPKGACVFCTMMQIGPCDYEAELQPLSDAPSLTAESSIPALMAEKQEQASLLEAFLQKGVRAKAKRPLPSLVEARPARAAPSAAVLDAETRARRALQGWELSGDPARQKDRESVARKSVAAANAPNRSKPKSKGRK